MADQPRTFTDDNFQTEVLDADQPVLVDFWAEWCGPCRMIAPTVEALAEEYDGRAKIGKLDVDDNQQTAASYNVRSIPTLLLFQNGEVVDQIVGVMPKDALAKKLDAVVEHPAE